MTPSKHEAWMKESDLLDNYTLGNHHLYVERTICLFGSMAYLGKPSNLFATLAAVIY